MAVATWSWKLRVELQTKLSSQAGRAIETANRLPTADRRGAWRRRWRSPPPGSPSAEPPAQRGDHDRQRGEIGERHRQPRAFGHHGEKQGGGQTRANGHAQALHHRRAVPHPVAVREGSAAPPVPAMPRRLIRRDRLRLVGLRRLPARSPGAGPRQRIT